MFMLFLCSCSDQWFLSLEYSLPGKWNSVHFHHGLKYNVGLKLLSVSLPLYQRLLLAREVASGGFPGNEVSRSSIILKDIRGEEKEICDKVVSGWRRQMIRGEEYTSIPQQVIDSGIDSILPYLQSEELQEKEIHCKAKIALVGKSYTGKSRFLNYLRGRILRVHPLQEPRTKPTIGMDSICLDVNGIKVGLLVCL